MIFKISPRVTAVGLASLLCLRAGVAFAQTPSLVELAQKEQERRKALKGATASKVYSDKDLPKTGTPAVASSLPPAVPPTLVVSVAPTDPVTPGVVSFGFGFAPLSRGSRGPQPISSAAANPATSA